MGLTIDDVFEEIGSMGRYQYTLVMVMGLMKMFGYAFQAMISTFLSAEPPWRCKDNSTVCNLTGIFKPGDDNYDFRCSISRHDWEFDTSKFNSVVSEWDLVCDVSALSSLTRSVLFLGFLIGVLLGGFLSDKFGRRLLVYIPCSMCNVLALLASFVHVYWLYVLLRVLVGVFVGCGTLCAYVLTVEFVGKRHRHAAGTALWFFWPTSLMMMALLAYLIRDWRTLNIVGAAPGLLQIFLWWYIPESSRWLLVKGRAKEASEQLLKVAKVNKKEIPLDKLTLVDENPTQQRLGDIRDLFSTSTMVTRTLISWFIWFVVTMVYYGVSFSAGAFGGNRYLVFFLTSLIEIPSNYTAIVACKKIGRKKTTIIGLIISSIASAVAVLFQRDLSNTGFLVARIIFASVIAKFFINMAFATIYVFSTELFPTVVRNLGVGSSSAVGRVGSMAAPYLIWLVRFHVLVPYSIIAALCLAASVLCCLLPETKDAPTLEVMDSIKGDSNSETFQMGQREDINDENN